MALTYKGSLNLGLLCPSVYASIGEVAVAIAAQFEGALNLQALWSVTPPDLPSVKLQLANGIAAMQFAASLGLPSISFDFAAVTSLIAKLNLSFSLTAVLEALLNASISVLALGYAGAGNALGAALTSSLATQWPDGTPSSGSATVFLFGAVASISQSTMAEFLSAMTFGPGLVYAGQPLTLAQLCPVVQLAVGQGTPAIQGQLDGALALLASLKVTPPSFNVTIPSLTAALDVMIALPSVTFILSALADLIARLDRAFNLLIQLGAILEKADATLFVYEYTGAANALGAAVTTALASTWGDGFTPTASACTAAVLGAVDSLTATTMAAFFGGA